MGGNIYRAVLGEKVGRFSYVCSTPPIEIWELVAERNHDIRHPRRKMRIGTAGNEGPGNPATSAPLDLMEGEVGSNSIG